MDVSTFIIPRQQADDPELRANFPAMELVRQSSNVAGTRNLHSRTTSLPEFIEIYIRIDLNIKLTRHDAA